MINSQPLSPPQGVGLPPARESARKERGILPLFLTPAVIKRIPMFLAKPQSAECRAASGSTVNSHPTETPCMRILDGPIALNSRILNG